MPMPAGPVATTYTWSEIEDELKDYLDIERTETDYDTVLQRFVLAAAKKADEYLCNPFEDLVPTLTFASAAEGESVSVNGQSFEAADAESADDREFDVSGTDEEAATSLAPLVNSNVLGGSEGAVGVAGVTATVDGAVVSFTKRYANVTDITVTTSNDTTLKVEIERTSGSVPADVILWCHAWIAWKFANRDGRLSERRESGVTGIDWGDRPDMRDLDVYAFQWEG
jgi:hypothetical protein